MATKTLTIADDVYDLLSGSKLPDESFSEEIRRIFSERKKKRLVDFAGILSDDEAKAMKKDLMKFRELDLRLEKERAR